MSKSDAVGEASALPVSQSLSSKKSVADTKAERGPIKKITKTNAKGM